ncbi:hypothetical protein FHS52_001690 [Erythromicrobium ramosum]|uniref:Uncharacterized protein n=1 Tax=Erythrobacter ramosus TaxID=35811 RepID=A0A6I4UNZ3_9SPHN|nr:hypothetical protein [Erythrobacter ramosus]MBB3775721.1 hypothetical protein [Erythrobacter ramosus]MXP39183.1 hypothetical protein [Erythrobacter ramosus]
MHADIIKQMRDEEAGLLLKLNAVRNLLSVYGEAPVATSAASTQSVKRTAPASRAREKVAITSFTMQTRMSVLLSLDAMVHAPGLLKTSALVEYIEKRGHEITGNNKVNALGALLARSEDVQGHGKSGWTVADRERALSILAEHLHNEKGPHSVYAGGPETAPYALTEEAME